MAGMQGQITVVTATIDFDSTVAGAQDLQTVAVPGAKVTHPVVVSAADIDAGQILHGHVSAANVVTVTLENTTGSTVNEASMSVYIAVIHG